MRAIASLLAVALTCAVAAAPASAQRSESPDEQVLACIPGVKCIVRACVPGAVELGLKRPLCVLGESRDDRVLDGRPRDPVRHPRRRVRRRTGDRPADLGARPGEHRDRAGRA